MKIMNHQKNTTIKPLNQNKMFIIAHIGFALWFYVGYRYGKSKCK